MAALIETFAHRLASQFLDLPGVRVAEITIDNPQALPVGLASVTVRLRDEVEQTAGSAQQHHGIEEKI